MPVLGFASICLFGLYLYLDGTGAAEAAIALGGAAAFYLVATTFLMRE